MADYVAKLTSGQYSIDLTGDTVDESKVLAPFTFTKNDGSPGVGTCTYDLDTSGATAGVGSVLEGETFGAQGEMKEGTLPRVGKQTASISSKDETVAPAYGFHDGTGAIGISQTERDKLIPQNIRENITILGVKGTMTGSESVTAEKKLVTPSFSKQNVLPTGADYLSEVEVAPIPVSVTPGPHGGLVVVVG